MKNPPSFQFYPQDFLSDFNVQSMTDEECGRYIKLLCHCWIEDGLPVKGGSPLVDLWLKQGSALARCFIEKGGKFRNPRLDKERQKQIGWREKSSLGGLHSAEKKRLLKGGSTKRQPKVNTSSSSSSSSSSSLREKDKSPSLCPRKIADVDIRLTQLLLDLMKTNNPDSSILKHLTEKRQAEWMNQCRLLREADGRSPEQIEAVIRFSQADQFWKQNILSMPKLREKWDQLWLKAKAQVEGNPGNGRGPESSRIGEWSPDTRSFINAKREYEKGLVSKYKPDIEAARASGDKQAEFTILKKYNDEMDAWKREYRATSATPKQGGIS